MEFYWKSIYLFWMDDNVKLHPDGLYTFKKKNTLIYRSSFNFCHCIATTTTALESYRIKLFHVYDKLICQGIHSREYD